MRIHSTHLVPGDLIHVEADMNMPCDAILLSGEAVMNEAMLTGTMPYA
jgi:cation-transporting ATPase 13A3/4/5